MARGMSFYLRPLSSDPTLARPSPSPASDQYLALRGGPHILRARTKNLLLQAVGASSISSLRTMTPHGGGGELGVGGSARCAGAYDRTRVRTRVNARAWQGLRRRLKAPSPSFESGATTFFNFGIGTGQAKEQEQSIFFLPFLAKLRPGLV